MGKLQCVKCRRVIKCEDYPYCEWCQFGFEKEWRQVDEAGGFRE